MKLDDAPKAGDLLPKIERLFELAGPKIADLDRTWDPRHGTPVYTVEGRYTTRGWTEWTQGFQYGCMLLQYDAMGEPALLELGRRRIDQRMPAHVTHIGVHDHGFNNISTYGNLRRLAREGRLDAGDGDVRCWEMALRASGAVQAARWTPILDADGRRTGGFVHSFNGPHSLFSDTMRSMRSLALAWRLGHVLMGENDEPIDLLGRSVRHCLATAHHNVYYGQGRDIYDTPQEAGRVAHESIFNVTDGRYRCPSTQQGYSPFSTWTRGLAWVLCGFAEQLEFLRHIGDEAVEGIADIADLGTIIGTYRRTAEATAEWYIRHSFADGMVYWDSAAPAIADDPAYDGPSDPYNDREPIDASAAAIAAQGFLRLGNHLASEGESDQAARYRAAARCIAAALFDEPYLSTEASHQGLILHSIYHRPRGWDHVPAGRRIPCGESSLWGDYHAMELALMLKREAQSGPYITFFDQPDA